MTRSKLWPAALLAGCLCNCSPAPSAQADEQKLMQTSREWSKVAASGSMDAVLGYFDDNAVLLSEGQPPVRGKPAIRANLEETAKLPGFRIAWEPQEAKVSGDMGYLIEKTMVTTTGPQGTPVTQQLQALTVWRKQADGSWTHRPNGWSFQWMIGT